MEENNREGKTRDLFKKIGDMKGTFHAKMGMIKDKNGRELTEAEEIKKRWQDYTEELYKKELNIPDNHDGVVTDLEPDILECEVKWALGSLSNNKASGGDEDKVWTTVHHDLQERSPVVSNRPEKHAWLQLNYSATMDQISAITSSAEYCEQFISYFCKMSRLLNTP
ncbi:Contactin-associated protein-like 2, partial [Varanus komodoensis]